jgi:sugar phosphate isomerase/epimerase
VKGRFGISTRIFRAPQLRREDLLAVAAHGFEVVELAAQRSALDYTNPAAVADFQQRLAEARLELHSVQVPLAEPAEVAVLIARRIPLPVLIVQATTPRETAKALEKLVEVAAPLNVKVAIDSTSMSPIGSLVHFVERGTDVDVGVCLDFEKAQRDGNLVDAIESVAEFLVAARIPVDSGIDWAAAMTTTQKIGYEGPLIFDADARGPSKETLSRAQEVRRRIERLLVR